MKEKNTSGERNTFSEHLDLVLFAEIERKKLRKAPGNSNVDPLCMSSRLENLQRSSFTVSIIYVVYP